MIRGDDAFVFSVQATAAPLNAGTSPIRLTFPVFEINNVNAATSVMGSEIRGVMIGTSNFTVELWYALDGVTFQSSNLSMIIGTTWPFPFCFGATGILTELRIVRGASDSNIDYQVALLKRRS